MVVGGTAAAAPLHMPSAHTLVLQAEARVEDLDAAAGAELVLESEIARSLLRSAVSGGWTVRRTRSDPGLASHCRRDPNAFEERVLCCEHRVGVERMWNLGREWWRAERSGMYGVSGVLEQLANWDRRVGWGREEASSWRLRGRLAGRLLRR